MTLMVVNLGLNAIIKSLVFGFEFHNWRACPASYCILEKKTSLTRDSEGTRVLHSGLVTCIIRYLDAVLLFLVKVRGSSGWIGTVCNKSNMENGSSLQIILPYSA